MLCFACAQPLAPSAEHCPACGQPALLRSRYRISGVLGRGGFGTVYAAQTLDGTPVAVKIIAIPDPADQAQFEQEALILAQQGRGLHFMPDIYDQWHTPQQSILVLEYIEGATLDQLVEQHGPWSEAAVLRFLRLLLAALAQLHSTGVLHRDVKPDNIKRTPAEQFVLLDFGLARQTQQSTAAIAKAFSRDYAAPEQIQGRPTDARADLYGLGATAWFLLTGAAPPSGVLRLALGEPLPPLPHIDAALTTLLQRLLEPEPADRPPSAHSALAWLDQHMPATPSTQQHPATLSTVPVAVGMATQPVAALPAQPWWSDLALERSQELAHQVLADLAWSSDGRYLAGCVYSRIVIWTADGQAVAQINTPAWLHALRWHPRLNQLACSGNDGLVRLYDVRGQLLSELKLHQEWVRALAWHPDGASLACGCRDGTIVRWLPHSSRQTAWRWHADEVRTLAWNPAGTTLVSGGFDRMIVFWDAAGQVRASITGRALALWNVAAWSPDGQSVALAASNDSVTLFSADGLQKKALMGHAGYINALVWCDEILASASNDHSIRLWSAAGTLLKTLHAHHDSVTALAWNPTTRTLVSAAHDGRMLFWRAQLHSQPV